jgi:hypothetical protein
MKAENRKFWASLLMLVIVCSLIGYLTFITVPEGNKDIIITVLGVLLGGASSAMPNLFGSKDSETAALKDQVRKLQSDNEKLEAMFTTLKAEHDRITAMLVKKFTKPPRRKPDGKNTQK